MHGTRNVYANEPACDMCQSFHLNYARNMYVTGTRFMNAHAAEVATSAIIIMHRQ